MIFTIILFSAFLMFVFSVFRHSARNKPHNDANIPRETNRITLYDARKILGVSQEANLTEINKAYKQLMAKFHPDHGGSEYIAIRINQARDLLLKRNL